MNQPNTNLRLTTVTVDCADPQALAQFWSTVLDTPIAGDFGDFVVLVAAPGTAGMVLQRVPEPRVAKNRMHIDLAGGSKAEVDRITSLGAKVIDKHEADGLTWTVLADPEGNEFCVTERVA